MEKKNTGLIVLVVVLIVAVITLGGFIIYDKVLSKAENSIENNENKDKEESYIKQIEVVRNFEEIWNNIPLINKYETKITDFNTIENKDKLTLAAEYLSNKNGFDMYTYFINPVSPDSIMNDALSKIFKDSITFENEDFGCCDDSHCHIKYDGENNQYINNGEVGHGSESIEIYYSKLISFEKKDNKYELTYVHLFDVVESGGYSGDTLYRKYNDNKDPFIDFYDDMDTLTNMNEIYVATGKTEDEQIREIVIEKMENLDNYDNFPKYKYIIELDENNNPLLSEYEFIKSN